MIVSILALLSALFLSVVSAYYSIIGLMAIFAATPFPIMIMGGTLELAKIITALWLHYNWDKAEWKIKSYLVTAVCILMMITSLGSFGYLSKAHLDQAVPSGDIQSQVLLFDERINNERENIANSRALIKQLDDVVNNKQTQVGREFTRKDGTKYIEDTAERALSIRRSQASDRYSLSKEIEKSQRIIVALQEERSPIASKFRKAEADVGPIRYIAAFVYGDNPDQNTLESAVRLVIIIIVLVFDPLAIVLLLAASTSLDWERGAHKEKKNPTIIPSKSVPIPQFSIDKEQAQQSVDNASNLTALEKKLAIEKIKFSLSSKNLSLSADLLAQKDSELSATEEELSELLKLLDNRANEINNLAPLVNDLEENYVALMEYDTLLQLEMKNILNENEALLSEKEQLEKTIQETEKNIASLTQALEEKNKKEIIEPQITTQVEPQILEQEIIQEESSAELPNKLELPNTKLDLILDNLPAGGNASFGVMFPTKPINGDLFLRVDYMPSKLFKWVGNRWIEVDKVVTQAYSFNVEYIKLLVEKISSGEYSLEDLNEQEQDQVARYLRNQPLAE